MAIENERMDQDRTSAPNAETPQSGMVSSASAGQDTQPVNNYEAGETSTQSPQNPSLQEPENVYAQTTADGTYHLSGSQIPRQDAPSGTSGAAYNNSYTSGNTSVPSNPPIYSAFREAGARQAGDQSYSGRVKKKSHWLRNTGIVALCVILCLGAGIGGSMIGASIYREHFAPIEETPNTRTPSANTNTSGTDSTSSQKEVSLPSGSALTTADPTNTKILTIKEIYNKNANAVVEIVTQYTTSYGYWGNVAGESAGSGVILTEDGYLVTNYHVIEKAEQIHIRLKSGDTYEATLVGSDEENDIAVLKIDAQDLSYVTLGDSSTVEVGDLCVAIGNPLGVLGGTLTDGIIGALDREIKFSDGETRRLLQHNAAVSPGSSGGGLFNESGDLIGIVNAKANSTEAEGIGFAIPINSVKTIIDDLITDGYVHGKIELGVIITTIKDGRTAMYYNVTEYGLYITQVNKNSNAERAGLKLGDRIVSVNDQKITELEQIATLLDEANVNDVLHFMVVRQGDEISIDVTLSETVPEGKGA